jgi:hypothetical protein
MVGGRGEVYIGFWWGNLTEDPGVDGRMILKWIYRKWDWIDLARIGTGGGLLKTL